MPTHGRVASRRLVKASDASIEPHVVAFSNLDLLNDVQMSMTCVYPRPLLGDFNGVVAAFEAQLPSFLNYFFHLSGRIMRNPSSGLPELRCHNQGAELVVAHADVELGTLNWALTEESLKKIQLPYAEEVPLSVQLVSFTCGGFAVVWGTHHLIGDGHFGAMLVKMGSEVVRSGTITRDAPTHDRSVLFRPRNPLSYSASVAGMFTPWDHEHQVNALTAEESFICRLYRVDGHDIARLREAASTEGRRATRVQAVSAYLWNVFAGVVAASTRPTETDPRCRMLWWVDGRRRLSPPPELRSRLRSYTGNVMSYAQVDASAHTVLAESLPNVATMVREAIAARNYDEMYQDLVDWVEEQKPARLIETPTVGLGSPTVAQTMVSSSFPIDADFGFGQAALVMPVESSFGRLCASLLSICARPGDTESWIVSAYIWPCLAAALESEEQRVFKPLTAEYLGLTRGNHEPADEARPRL
ncbi:coniferyl alcohol acyltransferase-like [Lolium rigidum]|uniref:coniferyl alcohol acyltransferase-like n=1 Tax=Lolium rigidum TaxID=89674 RepID=UPI001F5DBFED|nr:coniferyl alcohol acyltransferase-like [Lolium rigidum]